MNNGERIETYLIRGERGSGVCCLNGPAAWKGIKGDVIIMNSYGLVDVQDAKGWKPVVLFLENDKLIGA